MESQFKRDSITISRQDTLPEDFYYNIEEYESKPKVTNDSGIPLNLLKFFHSFGYDCTRRSNLHLLKGPTLLFASGTLVHLVNLKDNEEHHRFVRSCSGSGIGHVTVHPSGNYFAVAEKGTKPNILIYEFPSLNLFRVLKGGTEQAYSFVDFNPAGDLLASVGCAPDYMLTVWSWKQENIMLRSKAFSQDVFRVTFAPDHEGFLCSCGTSHIRFWKMAWTFTGLKLKGDIGRFGKTSLSDIEGFIQLPDGRVLSGSDWGNMLLWDGGLIELEIGRKGKNTCHSGQIMQFIIDEGELLTVGVDGFVRVWEMEAIEHADTTNEHGKLLIEPMNELEIGKDVSLMRIVKCTEDIDPSIEDGMSIWYAQDASGGIWKLDLTFSHTTKQPEKLYSFTSGSVSTLKTSPNMNLMAASGDQSLNVYDFRSGELVCSYTSPIADSRGTCMSWPLNLDMELSGKTIVAGFTDGVVRVLSLNVDINKQFEFTLKQAIKPHSSEVKCLTFNNEATKMATGGADNTVFLFNVVVDSDNLLQPIGFVQVEGAVNYMEFAPESFEKTCLLVSLQSGKVVEITFPEESKIDTTSSYLLQNIQMRHYTFKCVKPVLRQKEREKVKEEKAAKRLEKRKKQLKILIERGDSINEEQQQEFLDNDPEAALEPPEDELVYPSVPSGVLQASYITKDTFYLTMDDFDAGYLYECKFANESSVCMPPKEPVKCYPVQDSNDVPITVMKIGSNGKQILVGFKNGIIRVYPFEEKDLDSGSEFRLTWLRKFWQLGMHDCTRGHITCIEESFSGKQIISAGGDGCVFGYDLLDHRTVEESMRQAASLTVLTGGTGEDRRDIEDSRTYSIQDAKLKNEKDRLMVLADEKKKNDRLLLDELRKKLLELMQMNQQLPENCRIDRQEFVLDPSLQVEIEKETVRKIEKLKLEMQWDKAKAALQHEKIRNRFTSMVESDLVTVHSIIDECTVSSYRVAKLTDKFQILKDKAFGKGRLGELDVRAKILMGENNGQDYTKNEHGEKIRNERDSFDIPLEINQKKAKSNLKGRQAEMVAKAIKKAEDAKKRKLARQKEWNELYKSRPDDNYEDPKDVEDIEIAKKEMGDFKLKSAPDYMVPKHLRVDTDKKRVQMIKLEYECYTRKREFNEQLLELRDYKQQLSEEIVRCKDEVIRLQEKIPTKFHVSLPDDITMHPDELPYKTFEYDRETLLHFEEDRRQSKIGEAPRKSFYKASNNNVEDLKKRHPQFGKVTKQHVNPSSSHHRSSTQSTAVEGEKVETKAMPEPTELENLVLQMDQIRITYQRDQLIKSINDKITQFDGQLKLLRHQKIQTDVDLKMAQLRQITLLEELVLLKQYELRELDLLVNVSAKKKEMNECNEKNTTITNQLEYKKKEIDRLIENEKKLYNTFINSLGENNKFQNILTKIFKKKIKRKKPKVHQDGRDNDEYDDDDASETSSDESDDFSEDSDEDSQFAFFDDSICPEGCDQSLYDLTLELREKRLNMEESLQEERRTSEQLKKEQQAVMKKMKLIEVHLKQAVDAHNAFQLEKQRKLNELDVVVPLHLHQIEVIENGGIPKDLSQALVFENKNLDSLHSRIDQLHIEKKFEKDRYKEARMFHVKLIKNRKLIDERIKELAEKCQTLMKEKFGRVIDIDKLDNISINKPAEELKEKIRLTNIKNQNEIHKQKKYIETLKDIDTKLTKENTAKLQKLNVLMLDKKNIGKQIDKRQSNIEPVIGVTDETALNERKRLLQLVQMQSQDINSLKEEIGMLSRKGGHVLPPKQPPLPYKQEV